MHCRPCAYTHTHTHIWFTNNITDSPVSRKYLFHRVYIYIRTYIGVQHFQKDLTKAISRKIILQTFTLFSIDSLKRDNFFFFSKHVFTICDLHNYLKIFCFFEISLYHLWLYIDQHLEYKVYNNSEIAAIYFRRSPLTIQILSGYNIS